MVLYNKIHGTENTDILHIVKLISSLKKNILKNEKNLQNNNFISIIISITDSHE